MIVPALWEQQTFIDKAGPEIVQQMWTFNDKKGRPVCLIPEVTGLLQEQWRDVWQRRPMRIFYVSRCYRYERPQAGRYREFTQFGVEYLGGAAPQDRTIVLELLRRCMNAFAMPWELNDAVQRGLTYYTEDGFEAICRQLGAQKQVAGGGRYAEGIGWAIGVERLLLAAETG